MEQVGLTPAEEFMERWQFALLTASMNLAKERGEAPWSRERSKYADGWDFYQYGYACF